LISYKLNLTFVEEIINVANSWKNFLAILSGKFASRGKPPALIKFNVGGRDSVMRFVALDFSWMIFFQTHDFPRIEISNLFENLRRHSQLKMFPLQCHWQWWEKEKVFKQKFFIWASSFFNTYTVECRMIFQLYFN
jgi:hypothetical protein